MLFLSQAVAILVKGLSEGHSQLPEYEKNETNNVAQRPQTGDLLLVVPTGPSMEALSLLYSAAAFVSRRGRKLEDLVGDEIAAEPTDGGPVDRVRLLKHSAHHHR